MQLLNALLKEKTDSLFWDCVLKDKSYLVLQNNRQMLHILRYFILLFKNNTDKMIHKGCYLRKIEKKYCNVRIDGRRFFDKYVENNTKTCEKTATVATGQGDDYTVDFLIYYLFFFKKPQINTYRSR